MGRECRVSTPALRAFIESRRGAEIPERQRPGTSMDEARAARDGDGDEA